MQVSLFEVEDYTIIPDGWCGDDWETPPQVAIAIAEIVKGYGEGLRILEPAAGRGAIAKYLPANTTCIEINPIRHMAGAISNQNWICGNFLLLAETFNPFDVIVGNPPFSLAVKFLEVGAKIINRDGRILFLLPSDFFQPQARAKAFSLVGLSIVRQFPIVGRVGYDQEGIIHNERQCSDSIFEMRLSKYWSPAIQPIDPYRRLKG